MKNPTDDAKDNIRQILNSVPPVYLPELALKLEKFRDTKTATKERIIEACQASEVQEFLQYDARVNGPPPGWGTPLPFSDNGPEFIEAKTEPRLLPEHFDLRVIVHAMSYGEVSGSRIRERSGTSFDSWGGCVSGIPDWTPRAQLSSTMSVLRSKGKNWGNTLRLGP